MIMATVDVTEPHERDVFFQEKKKKETSSLSRTIHKNNFKWTKDLNIKGKKKSQNV